MIEKLKNLELVQILAIAFPVASVIAVSIIWFYESIRIPTLTTQIAFTENKVKDFEVFSNADKEEIKKLAGIIEDQKKETEKYKATAKQASDEINEIVGKLQQSEKEQAKIAKELYSARKGQHDSTVPISVAANPSDQAIISFEEAVLQTAEQEDAALLLIDNYMKELRLISYKMYVQEYDQARSKLKNSTDLNDLAENLPIILEIPISNRDFLLTIENLRACVTKIIVDHYRRKLRMFENHSSTSTYLSNIRQKSEILKKIESLVKKLKSNENPVGWNNNAAELIDDFVSNNEAPTDQAAMEDKESAS